MRRRFIGYGVRAGFILFALAVVLAIALAPTTASAAPSNRTPESVAASGNCVAWHHVRPGDNLTKLSYWYGVSVWAIAQANGLSNPSFIYVGQVLCIPSTYYPPQPVPPRPYPQPVPLPYCGQYYTVQRGDTLSGIARMCGTTTWALVNLNYIPNPNCIFVGQVLRIY